MSKNKRKASVHATRSWECFCGRVVFGNGGKSSHQRVCVVYKQHRLESAEKAMAAIDAGEWGKTFSPATVSYFREQYALDVERLRAELESMEKEAVNG